MGLIKEFKEFAMKGNVVDMAVGVIIGGAFGKIVNSMVKDIMMPIVGSFGGKGSFGQEFIYLGTGERPKTLELVEKSGEPYIAWGPFAQATIDFLIMAFSIFIIIKLMNKATELTKLRKEAAPAAPPATPEDVLLLREIRDALKSR
ncbi:MAG: large conductance mechanosensitive channel protein MscL [Planctomyces sp.]|nr:large conductance mechanosensitive channel protein MscL [Planctomyces sp.]